MPKTWKVSKESGYWCINTGNSTHWFSCCKFSRKGAIQFMLRKMK